MIIENTTSTISDPKGRHDCNKTDSFSSIPKG